MNLDGKAAIDGEVEGSLQIYSTEFSLGDFTAAAEYKYTKSVNTLFDSTTKAEYPMPITSKMDGYYFLASYRFTDWLQVGTYYSLFYPNKEDRDGDLQPQGKKYYAWQKDFAVSARFDISEYWLIKTEIHSINGAALTLADNPDNTKEEQDWLLFALKITFNF